MWPWTLGIKKMFALGVSKRFLRRVYDILNHELVIKKNVLLEILWSSSTWNYFDWCSVPISNVHIVGFFFFNTESAWQFYSFITNVMEETAIFINYVNLIVFHVCDDDIAQRIATQAVRFKVAGSWSSLIPEAQHTSGVCDNYGSDIRHTNVAITVFFQVGRTDE